MYDFHFHLLNIKQNLHKGTLSRKSVTENDESKIPYYFEKNHVLTISFMNIHARLHSL